ncbi:hypothetical protein QWZ10_06095 [Paracoccus cavernae]|uniref:Uncharacterized protein n=1 Tax=Paracoccus cavernae TaxID=1571207 RepID=A0ABT8D545_9RHOB|nr:hypothetical protein [Paracoccus cavernae]
MTQKHPVLSRRAAIGLGAAFWLQRPLAALAESPSFDLSPDQAARAKTAPTLRPLPRSLPVILS